MDQMSGAGFVSFAEAPLSCVIAEPDVWACSSWLSSSPPPPTTTKPFSASRSAWSPFSIASLFFLFLFPFFSFFSSSSSTAGPAATFPASALLCTSSTSLLTPSSAYSACGTHLWLVLGVVSSNILSTCSRLSPFVSGTKKYAKTTHKVHVEPQTKKTFALRFPWLASTMYGVM